MPNYDLMLRKIRRIPVADASLAHPRHSRSDLEKNSKIKTTNSFIDENSLERSKGENKREEKRSSNCVRREEVDKLSGFGLSADQTAVRLWLVHWPRLDPAQTAYSSRGPNWREKATLIYLATFTQSTMIIRSNNIMHFV